MYNKPLFPKRLHAENHLSHPLSSSCYSPERLKMQGPESFMVRGEKQLQAGLMTEIWGLVH